MPHDNVLARKMGFGGQVGDFDPSEQVDRLVFHAHLGIVVGMDDDMRWRFVIGQKGFEKLSVGIGDYRQVPFKAVAFHGVVTSMVEPAEGFAASVQDPEHHLFVVSHQRKQLCFFLEFHHSLDDTFGVRASIDVVTDGHEDIVFRGFDSRQQRIERPEAAVDITDCDRSCHRKIKRRKRASSGSFE